MNRIDKYTLAYTNFSGASFEPEDIIAIKWTVSREAETIVRKITGEFVSATKYEIGDVIDKVGISCSNDSGNYGVKTLYALEVTGIREDPVDKSPLYLYKAKDIGPFVPNIKGLS